MAEAYLFFNLEKLTCGGHLEPKLSMLGEGTMSVEEFAFFVAEHSEGWGAFLEDIKTAGNDLKYSFLSVSFRHVWKRPLENLKRLLKDSEQDADAWRKGKSNGWHRVQNQKKLKNGQWNALEIAILSKSKLIFQHVKYTTSKIHGHGHERRIRWSHFN